MRRDETRHPPALTRAQRERTRRSREALVDGGLLAQRPGSSGVPGDIERSWRRCVGDSVPVAPDRIDYRAPDSPDLCRAAGPVLDRLAHSFADVPVAMVLSDATGRIVLRHVDVRRQRDTMDRASAAEGFDFSERSVGTNGLGTVLVERRPVLVRGPEHYNALLENITCAGTPVVEPGTGRLLGSFSLACFLRDVHPLMTVMAADIGRQIESRILDGSGDRHRRLVRAYLAADRAMTGALVVDSDTVLANRLGLAHTGPELHPLLWRFLCEHGPSSARRMEIPLADGWHDALVEPIDDGARTAWSIRLLRVRPDRSADREAGRPGSADSLGSADSAAPAVGSSRVAAPDGSSSGAPAVGPSRAAPVEKSRAAPVGSNRAAPAIGSNRTELLVGSDPAAQAGPDVAGPGVGPRRAASMIGSDRVGDAAGEPLHVYEDVHRRLAQVMRLGETVAVTGGPGTGKLRTTLGVLRRHGAGEPLVVEPQHDPGWFAAAREAAAAGCPVVVRRVHETPSPTLPQLEVLIDSGARVALTADLTRADDAVVGTVRRVATTVRLPALAGRREHLPCLVRTMLAELPAPLSSARLTAPVWDRLMEWHWPGDVAELRATVVALARRADGGTVDIDDLPDELRTPHRPRGRMESAEREAVADALREARGNRSGAARRLGIGRTTLYRKMREFGLG